MFATELVGTDGQTVKANVTIYQQQRHMSSSALTSSGLKRLFPFQRRISLS